MAFSKTNRIDSLTSLHRLEFILQQQSDRFLRADIGVGFGQVRIMEEINDRLPRSQREIALRLGQTEANISRQVRDLKHRGLVKITANQKDKRQRDVSLTAKGKKKYEKAQKLLDSYHKEHLRLLSRDQKETFELGIRNLLASLGGAPPSR